MRHHHFDRRRWTVTQCDGLRVRSSESDPVDSSVTFARAFSAQLHRVVAGGDERIRCCVAVAEAVGRLVLSDLRNRNGCIILRVIHAQDMNQNHLVIRRPEHGYIGVGVGYIRRCVPVVDRHGDVGAGTQTPVVSDR